ncbi:MAG TPA: HD domain-containing phosphohydrolase [Anaerolineaceae bacterium]|nr:HD domain-containing phosphohydrolase [Anaerolineaceae bacterium]
METMQPFASVWSDARRLLENKKKAVLRVVFWYLFLAIAWIFLTDQIVIRLTNDTALITLIQTYKGLAFVVFSGVVIYVLLLQELRKRETAWLEYVQERNLLLSRLSQKHHELEQAYDRTIEGWARALEMRSHEVQEHSLRVTEIAVRLGAAMGLSPNELDHLRRGSLLHDIGKMCIPDRILLKEGPLDEDERALIEQHPEMGFDMLAPIEFLRPALDIPRYHHEKWDGSGYPSGLKGDQIPRAARIFAVIDVWDALTSNRSYRLAITPDQAQKYICDQAGKAFDPEVVRAFTRLMKENPQLLVNGHK